MKKETLLDIKFQFLQEEMKVETKIFSELGALMGIFDMYHLLTKNFDGDFKDIEGLISTIYSHIDEIIKMVVEDIENSQMKEFSLKEELIKEDDKEYSKPYFIYEDSFHDFYLLMAIYLLLNQLEGPVDLYVKALKEFDENEEDRNIIN